MEDRSLGGQQTSFIIIITCLGLPTPMARKQFSEFSIDLHKREGRSFLFARVCAFFNGVASWADIACCSG